MNVSDFANDPREVIGMTMNAAFAAGDLILNNESGIGSVFNPAVGVANSNVTTVGPTALKANTNLEGNLYGINGQTPFQNTCELGNGNAAFCYSGDGVTATTNVNVRIMTPLGVDVIPKLIASTDTTVNCYRVAKLNATQFVLAWSQGTNLKFMILNNDGTTAVAAATVSVLGATGSLDNWSMAVLNSTDIIFAYDKQTSRNCVFQRYNAAGVAQGAETTVDAAANIQRIAVKALSTGEFIVFFRRSAATAAFKWGRYSALGVIVGAVVTITTASTLSGGMPSNGIIELSGGRIVIAAPGSADNSPDLYIYTAANALVTTIDLGTSTYCSNEFPQLIALTSGGFAHVARSQTPTTYLTLFDQNGGTVMAAKSIDNGSDGSNAAARGSGVFAFSLGAAGYVCFVIGYNNGTGNYTARLFQCSTAGVVTGTPVVLQSSINTGLGTNSAVLLSSGIVAYQYFIATGTALLHGLYNTMRKSILGVADNSGAAGATAKVKTKGTYTINQGSSFGGNFDQRTATVPGPRGTVVGNGAVLFGMS